MKKLIEVRLRLPSSAFSSSACAGALSAVISPSLMRMIRPAYVSASSGLCVTMMISLFAEISFNISMICTEVSESSAPVGSSASRMSGSLTRARAIATRCICPPESWLGFLVI